MSAVAHTPPAAEPSWNGKFELPTLQKLGGDVKKDIVPSQVAAQWFNKFQAAMLASQPDAIADLFIEGSFWRDLLSLSPDFRTLFGSRGIRDYLDKHLSLAHVQSLELLQDTTHEPVLRQPFPDLALLQLCFDFRTTLGTGQGVCRLVPMAGGEWKAYTMFTSLTGLNGHPEKIGPLREQKIYYGDWEAERKKQIGLPQNETAVLIVGAGHSGLELAARLHALGVPSLLVERNPRVGDNWRNRYKSLCLHDPVWYDQMAYMPFPPTWPVYAPAHKLADWMELYANAHDLNVWTSARLGEARWDAARESWTVKVEHDGAARTLTARHLVFATGLGGGKPRIPSFPGEENFRGQILHSSDYRDARVYRGEKVVVVGAGNSASDIARDCAEAGVDVTIVQRSPTLVISSAAIRTMLSGLFNETTPTEVSDKMNASFPLAVSRQLHQRLFPYLANTIDKEMLAGVNAAGFKTYLGPENGGLIPLAYGRGGGYFVDTGVSKHIIEGRVKVKSDVEVSSVTRRGLILSDGTELDADRIILATGYGDPRDLVEDVCGAQVRGALKPVWGLDEEGEIRSVWRPTGHKNLWFAIGNLPVSRYYSSFLALQIKAQEEGLRTSKGAGR